MKKILVLISVVVMTAFSLICAEALSYLPGDVDGNNKITASDARKVLRASADLDTLTLEQKIISDMNGDKKITAADARIILRISASLDSVPEYVSEENTTADGTTTEQNTEKPAEPTTKKPSTDEPTTKKPSTDEPTTKEPITEEPTTEEPIPEEPASDYPDDIDSFFSGKFYLTGTIKDATSGNTYDVSVASDSKSSEVGMSIQNHAVKILTKDDSQYLKFSDKNDKKYYIEMSKTLLESFGIDSSDASFIFGSANNMGTPSFRHGYWNSIECNIYTFRKPDTSKIVFYVTEDDKIIRIVTYDKNGSMVSSIDVGTFSSTVPTDALTLDGYTKATLLTLAAVLGDMGK